MPWRLETHQRAVFARNPLEAVIVQLRFHPILKIAARVADFQERVRTRFPRYDEATNQAVEIGPEGVTMRSEQEFRFRTVDGSAKLALGPGALALEVQQHDDRDVLLQDTALAIDALRQVSSPIAPTRLGLRYINSIDQGRISQDLARSVDWRELVAGPLWSIVDHVADLHETQFVGEISSTISPGMMTFRYGLLRPSETDSARFRLDFDRYVDSSFDVGSAVTLLEGFSDDIYSAFAMARGPALEEWMSMEKDNQNVG